MKIDFVRKLTVGIALATLLSACGDGFALRAPASSDEVVYGVHGKTIKQVTDAPVVAEANAAGYSEIVAPMTLVSDAEVGQAVTSSLKKQGRVAYLLSVPKAGTYFVRLKTLGKAGDANKWLVSVDGQAQETWDLPVSSRYILVQSPKSYALAAGKVKVVLIAGERDTRLAAIMLVADGVMPTPSPTPMPTPTATPTPPPVPTATPTPPTPLDPKKLPGQNFDLSLWKVTLPIDANGMKTGNAIEILQLANYQAPPWFATGADGAMVFAAPTDGATTSGSHYPRSELREMTASGTLAAWKIADGGVLSATLAVNELPKLDKGGSGRVVIGQIHGPDDELCRLYYDNGQIYFYDDKAGSSQKETKFTLVSSANLPSNIPLNAKFDYSIVVAQGSLTVAAVYNGTTYSASEKIGSFWTNQAVYFKAGVYVQVGKPGSGAGSVGTGQGQVSFYRLPKPSHGNVVTPTPTPTPPVAMKCENGMYNVGDMFTKDLGLAQRACDDQAKCPNGSLQLCEYSSNQRYQCVTQNGMAVSQPVGEVMMAYVRRIDCSAADPRLGKIDEPWDHVKSVVALASTSASAVKGEMDSKRGAGVAFKTGDGVILNAALKAAAPGDIIMLASKSGGYKDLMVNFSPSAVASAAKPIYLIGETKGVPLTGNSALCMVGTGLQAWGFHFTDGNGGQMIRVGGEKPCKSCRVSRMRVDKQKALPATLKKVALPNGCGYYDGDGDEAYPLYVKFFWVKIAGGERNEVSYNTFQGKQSLGSAVFAERKDGLVNRHVISHNEFLDRTPALNTTGDGLNDNDLLRVGTSTSSFQNSNTIIEYNLFRNNKLGSDEPEIIASKASGMILRFNTFDSNEGVLSLRHGNFATVEGNWFKDGLNPSGGVRLIDGQHIVVNNVVENTTGNTNFHAPLVLRRGADPATKPGGHAVPSNSYMPVEDSVVAFNRVVNTRGDGAAVMFGAGDSHHIYRGIDTPLARTPQRNYLAYNCVDQSAAGSGLALSLQRSDLMLSGTTVSVKNNTMFGNLYKLANDMLVGVLDDLKLSSNRYPAAAGWDRATTSCYGMTQQGLAQIYSATLDAAGKTKFVDISYQAEDVVKYPTGKGEYLNKFAGTLQTRKLNKVVLDQYFRAMLTGQAPDWNLVKGLDGEAALKELYYDDAAKGIVQQRLTFQQPLFLKPGDVGAGY